MSPDLCDSILNVQAFIILILSIYFIINYLKTNNAKFLKIEGLDNSNQKKIANGFGLSFLFGIIVGVLVLYNSWWPYHPLLCFSLIFCLGTIFIHETFLLSFFILLLFMRPWEVLEERYFNQAQTQIAFVGENLVSLPKLWFLLLLGNLIISWKIKKNIKWNILDKSVALFVLWMLIPILVKNSKEDFRLYFDTLFSSGLIYFLVRWYVRDIFCYRMISKTLGLVGLFLLVTAILQYVAAYGIVNDAKRVEAFGLFQNSNDLAALLVLCSPFMLKDFDSKFIKSLIATLLLFAIYTTQSRGAFIGVVVSFLAFFTAHIQFKDLSLKKTIAMALVVGVLFVVYTSFLGRTESDIHVSSWGRINNWVAAVRMAFYSPIWGVGFNNYPKNFERYTLEFLEFGERSAHSSFFLVIAEGGFIGFLIYFSLLKKGLQYAIALRKVQPVVFASFVGYLITMIFLAHSYLFYIYILLALISALYMLNEEKDLKSTPAN